MESKLFAATGTWTSVFLGRCHGVMRMLSVPDKANSVQGQGRMLLLPGMAECSHHTAATSLLRSEQGQQDTS